MISFKRRSDQYCHHESLFLTICHVACPRVNRFIDNLTLLVEHLHVSSKLIMCQWQCSWLAQFGGKVFSLLIFFVIKLNFLKRMSIFWSGWCWREVNWKFDKALCWEKSERVAKFMTMTLFCWTNVLFLTGYCQVFNFFRIFVNLITICIKFTIITN